MPSHLLINQRIHYDAYFEFLQGGSKARKLKYILNHAKAAGATAIVSAGSAESNHARDCALAAAELGWRCKLIIHDKEDYRHNNLFLMKLAGAELEFCELSEVAQRMDIAMDLLRHQGNRPYYIWGGGHSVYGSLALYDAAVEFISKNQGWVPDYVIVPSGTGGTQAGLHLGFSKHNLNTKVIGVSVAREKSRGEKSVSDAIKELVEICEIDDSNVSPPIFLDNWRGDGYGAIYPRLLEVIKDAAAHGVLTDPTYTGKAMCALYDMVESGFIEKNAKVLFWHTGGLLNLLDSKNLLSNQS